MGRGEILRRVDYTSRLCIMDIFKKAPHELCILGLRKVYMDAIPKEVSLSLSFSPYLSPRFYHPALLNKLRTLRQETHSAQSSLDVIPNRKNLSPLHTSLVQSFKVS